MVSMYQALFICGAALWVILTDPARAAQNAPGNWAERLWGYNGAAGMCQAFAAGYFVWDVVVSLTHLDVMGASSLVHAVSALGVTLIGFVSILLILRVERATDGSAASLCQLLRAELRLV